MPHQMLTKDTMMSVREMPWHGLGAVLDEYPTSIDDALTKSGLPWTVAQGGVIVTRSPGDPFSALSLADQICKAYESNGQLPDPAALERLNQAMKGVPKMSLEPDYRANFREDDNAVLGIVSDGYKVVQNRDAFKFLDALIGSDLYFETAGSLLNGKKVWVLARLPEWVEIGGDASGIFVFIANTHDGSMAVTSAVTPVRIVCGNTWTAALRRADQHAERVYKFRHTGDLQLKFDEARRVMGMTINYSKQFKILGDQLALKRVTVARAEKMAMALNPIEEGMGKRAVANRQRSAWKIVDIFKGGNNTAGNAPGTAWTYANAVAEYSDWCRRYTQRTDQMARSFEDSSLKQRGLDQAIALL